MLNVSGVIVHYGTALALRGINLKVKSKELVAVLGPNGAGKTTLLRSIFGLKKITEGSISFMGKEIHKLSPYDIAKSGISLCPERRRLFPEMTVLENLEMGAYLRKAKDEVKDDLERVYGLFPVLKERRDQRAGTLSGGEQQMLAIGRALMSRPKLLMLDEPSLGLSPIFKGKIFKNIQEIRDEGVTVLLVEQDVHSTLRISDRAYILEAGNVVLEGSGEELLKNPQVKKSYLGI
ncbi:MAG: ABC transporter ATP-binding protein [Candidatus Nezhaarchaeota archaeon]|nr:ABC transporter ATP-binding protein [Candidatus Nezhaarchaeota archaeon]